MMRSLHKKRYIFSVLTILILIVFFLFKKGAISKTTQNAELVTNLNAEPNFSARKNLKDFINMKLDSSSNPSAEGEDDQNSECWKKIERQHDSMDVYVQKHNEEFSKVVKPWFYNTNFEKQKNPVEKSKQGKFFWLWLKLGY